MDTRTLKPKTVVLLNSPAGAGKDTIGAMLAEVLFGDVCQFKDKLFEIAILAANVSETEWFLRYNQRELKEKPWDKLGGLTQREYLIRISEEWVKPTLGDDYFT